MKLPRLLAALAIAGALVLPQAAAPASAAVTDMACNFDFVTFNACLNFDEPQVNVMNAHVGLDAKMPQRYAQEIVDIGGLNAQAQLWFTNGNGEQTRFIASMAVRPGFPRADPVGFELGLDANDLSRASLNINTARGAQESFFVVVSYFDPNSQGSWKSFRTGTVTGDFAPR
ncbi:hypothetical protein [Actinocrispum sp. NPDC049592]|uniref:hypothetical protein n=1 Tax=Actinocrispum sp. NPDC049592 TaxID=3154835 RepID=UPI00341511EA